LHLSDGNAHKQTDGDNSNIRYLDFG
jgi:hypothetical protein